MPPRARFPRSSFDTAMTKRLALALFKGIVTVFMTAVLAVAFYRRIVTVFMTSVVAVTASAQERVLQFDSAIAVHKDGSLTVTERIRVRSENRKIRHGIYRDFPIRYREQGGYWRRVGFSIISVRRDNHGEPFFTQPSGDHKRIYIGDKNTYVDPGTHIYEITYKTTRQLRYFDKYDELYWNVTGNRWDFPIDKVIARVTLPEGAGIFQQRGYTGRYGQRGADYRVVEQTGNSITYETTRPLGRYQGFTFAIGFQKGVVAEPSDFQRMLWRLWDNLGFVILLAGMFGVVGYYWFAWARVGKDPDDGVIIPLFSPPEGLSPAAISYIHYRKFKKAGGGSLPFVAALVSLAVKKRLRIIDNDGDITVERVEDSTRGLPAGERTLFQWLLGSRKRIEFTQANASTVQSARSNFRAAITSEHGDVYFRNNLHWFIAGAVLSAAVILLFLLFYQPDDYAMGTVIATILSSLAGSLLLSMGLRRLGNTIPGGSSRLWGTVLTILGCIAIIPAVLMVIAADTTRMPFWVPFALAVITICNVLFFTLLRAPTELGQKVSDEIEGFKLYLSVAEADRMNMKGAPDVNKDVFEKLLPYAIALGVEKPWSKAFESYMARVHPEQQGTAYQPTWYHGSSGWDSTSLGAATAGIVSGVSAGLAQATPPSSSGSGGGGGGFSGGGGGGGGGGGW